MQKHVPAPDLYIVRLEIDRWPVLSLAADIKPDVQTNGAIRFGTG
ncbi:hypothetical protein BXY39_3017 [Eilatimonas milleporae]|uniref:Uncharacterized protein n=1 Tax=Eilatimonas milleporae TaxID=911205 RepID=A0A3M0C200_9PROT|nr:hypothetical protein BXY39_3017 [Eilatimonas milleporae]